MDRAEAIIRLREHEAELKALGVQHLYLPSPAVSETCGIPGVSPPEPATPTAQKTI